MNKLSLVLDLSSSLYLGLVDDQGRVLSRRIRGQGIRGETAHSLLDECLAEAGADVSAIADICVGIGPGSFTGIRVCAAMAQGLAFASRLPLYPFSSLAAIAACAPQPEATAVAAIAAIAGRYYVRRPAGENVPSGRESGTSAVEVLQSAEELAGWGVDGALLMTSGNVPDLPRLQSAFSAMVRFEDAADFGRIVRLAHGSPAVTDGVLRPNYLMASAAEEKRRAAGGTPGVEGSVVAQGPGSTPP
ncbi:MAG: tRNA (adenosine(37)-N6)-threonylcarbamoyltransferase complex dimerization subunit type 1 TsaB [Fibrobacterota bacterium]|nr:tRNA (adenosine(37)-N6)-threonylcarbamoyltransferase complex dimerization subunit type 1 TsaB [Fibrobacterota bacterium]